MKWKPSRNPDVEGFISKSFSHSAKGDAISNQDKVREKWANRLSTILNTKVDLRGIDLFIKGGSYAGTLDFKFKDSEGKQYRIYKAGESSSSSQYIIQKYK